MAEELPDGIYEECPAEPCNGRGTWWERFRGKLYFRTCDVCDGRGVIPHACDD